MTTAQQFSNTLQDVSKEILLAVEALKQGSGFGSIEIIVHDGRVTQIERREKLRFQAVEKKIMPTANRSG